MQYRNSYNFAVLLNCCPISVGCCACRMHARWRYYCYYLLQRCSSSAAHFQPSEVSSQTSFVQPLRIPRRLLLHTCICAILQDKVLHASFSFKHFLYAGVYNGRACFHEPDLHAAVCYQYCIYFCLFSSTTFAGTCIVAYLPRCLPSNMQNATAMNVTLRSGQHVVLFAYEPSKYILYV